MRHRNFFLMAGLAFFLTAPVAAQKPAVLLEVQEAGADRMALDRRESPAQCPRWEDLAFVFAGPEQITRDVVTEAQVTVFDRKRHRIAFQTEIYEVSGSELEPGPNFTSVLSLCLQGENGRQYKVLVGSGVIELVVPLAPGEQNLLHGPTRPQSGDDPMPSEHSEVVGNP